MLQWVSDRVAPTQSGVIRSDTRICQAYSSLINHLHLHLVYLRTALASSSSPLVLGAKFQVSSAAVTLAIHLLRSQAAAAFGPRVPRTGSLIDSEINHKISRRPPAPQISRKFRNSAHGTRSNTCSHAICHVFARDQKLVLLFHVKTLDNFVASLIQ